MIPERQLSTGASSEFAAVDVIGQPRVLANGLPCRGMSSVRARCWSREVSLRRLARLLRSRLHSIEVARRSLTVWHFCITLGVMLFSHRGAPSFTAIDFETANFYPNSACALGLVRVDRGRITRRAYLLIRPPFRWFQFTALHGISWATVSGKSSFAELWPRIRGFFRGIDFLAAHNASFDSRVLRSTCAWYGLDLPWLPFECTVRIARSTWGLRPTTLSHVAQFLGLRLDHHHAGSDAEACARIVLAAAG